MRIKSGIYRIVNLSNKKYYIGSAVNLYRRWGQHKYYLIKGTHANKHLQSAWDKHGVDTFKFEVLEYVGNVDDLIKIEQMYLDYADYYNIELYNICFIANSTKGIKWTEHQREVCCGMKGKHHTDEAKEKMSNSQKGKKQSAASIEKRKQTMQKYWQPTYKVVEDWQVEEDWDLIHKTLAELMLQRKNVNKIKDH